MVTRGRFVKTWAYLWIGFTLLLAVVLFPLLVRSGADIASLAGERATLSGVGASGVSQALALALLLLFPLSFVVAVFWVKHKESVERIHLLMGAASDGVMVLDYNGLVVDCSSTMEELLGQSLDALRKHPVRDVVGLSAVADWVDSAKAGGELGGAVEFEIVCAEGSLIVVSAGIRLVEIGGGRYFYILAQDVSGRKAVEASDRRSRILFREVLEALPEGIIVYNDKLECVAHSVKYGQVMDLPRAMVQEESFRYEDEVVFCYQRGDFGRDDSESSVLKRRVELMRAHQSFSEQRLLATGRWVDIRWIPLSQEMVLVSCFDITGHKEAEGLLASAKREAEEANAAKSLFLSSMSHEIRTPLNAIIGTAYLLGQQEKDPELTKDIESIEASSRSLLTLINDVLDFSKVEAGELDIEPHVFSLSELLDDLRSMFEPMCERKGIELIFDPFQGKVPDRVVADSGRLRQMLINLLNNATKFTDAGHVSLRVALADAYSGRGDIALCFFVSDTGIGIPKENLEKLFRPFKQSEVSIGRVYGGTGLGLSIVKRIGETMGGEVGVESEEGKGSTFWLKLPFDQSTECTKNGEEHQTLRPLRVVVLEPCVEAVERLRQGLKQLGWAADFVGTADALQQTLEQAEEPFDCVLADGGALVKGGWKRSTGVALVGLGSRDDFGRGLDDCCPDRFLSRPFSAVALFNAVNGAVGLYEENPSHVMNCTLIDAGIGAWLDGVRVIAVDDNSINRTVIQRVLSREGAFPVSCSSGQEAIDLLVENPDGYDAVLMDLQMPELDGSATTVKLRREYGLEDIPVIALTAGATTTERDRALAAGMGEFLVKPVDPPQLIRVIRTLVEARRGVPLEVGERENARTSVLDSDAVEVALAPVGVEDSWPQLAGIDPKVSKENFCNDEEFFAKLSAIFLSEYDGFAECILSELDAGNLEQAAVLAHRVRGGAANMGANVLRDAAGELEEALKDGLTPEDSVNTLLQAYRHVYGALDGWLKGRS